ncbi:MAG: hypothetical protein E6Q66_05235 [Pedobacter sp.]|nr:MAG: hypothetical protein E6Q66_05235 [Pedobacter sp.]
MKLKESKVQNLSAYDMSSYHGGIPPNIIIGAIYVGLMGTWSLMGIFFSQPFASSETFHNNYMNVRWGIRDIRLN